MSYVPVIVRGHVGLVAVIDTDERVAQYPPGQLVCRADTLPPQVQEGLDQMMTHINRVASVASALVDLMTRFVEGYARLSVRDRQGLNEFLATLKIFVPHHPLLYAFTDLLMKYQETL